MFYTRSLLQAENVWMISAPLCVKILFHLSFLCSSSWSPPPSGSLCRSHGVFDSEASPHPVWLCWRGTPSLLKTNTFFHLVGSPELSKITLMWSVRGQPVKSVTVELLKRCIQCFEVCWTLVGFKMMKTKNLLTGNSLFLSLNWFYFQSCGFFFRQNAQFEDVTST